MTISIPIQWQIVIDFVGLYDVSSLDLMYQIYKTSPSTFSMLTNQIDKVILLSCALRASRFAIVKWLVLKVGVNMKCEKFLDALRRSCTSREAHDFSNLVEFYNGSKKECLVSACRKGSQTMVKWMESHLCIKTVGISAVSAACEHRHYRLMKWLICRYKIKKNECLKPYLRETTGDNGYRSVFCTVCLRGEREVALWLAKRYNITVSDEILMPDTNLQTYYTGYQNVHSTFCKMYMMGDLQGLKWITKMFNLKDESGWNWDEHAMEAYTHSVCGNVVNWLFNVADTC